MRTDYISDLSVHGSWLAILNGFHQRVISDFNKSTRTLMTFADQISLIQVGVEPVLIYCYV